jgi:hypothetical protein
VALVRAELLVLVGRPEDAIALMTARRFSPWEGGEGEAIRVWTMAQRAVADRALAAGDPDRALSALRSGVDVPESLGEAPHPLANRSDLLLALGDAAAATRQHEEAEVAWRQAANSVGDFTTMAPVPHSPMTYYSVLAARRIGELDRAERLTCELVQFVERKRHEPAAIDYFATSLPTMLIFREDVELTQGILIAVMEAQLALLDGEPGRAHAILAPLAHRDPADARIRELLQQAEVTLVA